MNSQGVPVAAFRIALILGATLIAACASEPFNVAPRPPDKFEKLGPTSGRDCGWLFFGPTALNFIPVGLDSRVERAYANAVQKSTGATALVSVTMQEDWTWWVVGTTRCVTITGEAIR